MVEWSWGDISLDQVAGGEGRKGRCSTLFSRLCLGHASSGAPSQGESNLCFRRSQGPRAETRAGSPRMVAALLLLLAPVLGVSLGAAAPPPPPPADPFADCGHDEVGIVGKGGELNTPFGTNPYCCGNTTWSVGLLRSGKVPTSHACTSHARFLPLC